LATAALCQNELQSGMAFIYKDNFILSSDHWNWVIDIDFDNYKTPIIDFQSHIKVFFKSIKFKNDIKSVTVKDTLKSFLKRSGELLNKINDIQLSIHPIQTEETDEIIIRNKRSLIDMGESILQWAFSTVTHKDLEFINDKINAMNITNQKIVTMLGAQITFINQTYSLSQTNAQNIQKLNNLTGHIFAYFHAIFPDIQHSISSLAEEFDLWISVDITLQSYQEILNDLTLSVTKLNDIWHETKYTTTPT
jgi:hypothetical protein